ncbi:MAG TPA: GNAT family N-acetyltransferase [Phenylobacterium sp.]
MSCLALSPFIESRRLRLRGPCRSDAARLAQLANDYDVVKMTGSMPYPYGEEHAHAYLDRVESLDPQSHAHYVIDFDGAPIGTLGFDRGPHGRCEIGYWIGRPYWGQGLATEAALAALDWAREDWGRRLVVACHYADNPASGAVLIKAGFLYTGDVEPKFSTARGCEAPVRWMVWLA